MAACWGAGALLLLLSAGPSNGLQVWASLSPIEITGEPGAVISRSFALQLGAEQPATRFVARTEDVWPSEDGTSFFYRPAGSHAHSCAAWVRPEPAAATVLPGETLTLRLRIAIPADTRAGGYWCALTVDEVGSQVKAAEGVGARFTASLSTVLFVAVPPLEQRAEIVDLNVADGRVRVLLQNHGNAPLWVGGRVELLRLGDAEPLAVVPLRRVALLLGPAPRRWASAALPTVEALPPGRYRVRAVVDLGVDDLLRAEKILDIAVGAGR